MNDKLFDFLSTININFDDSEVLITDEKVKIPTSINLDEFEKLFSNEIFSSDPSIEKTIYLSFLLMNNKRSKTSREFLKEKALSLKVE